MVSLYYPLFAVSVLLVSITLALFSNTLGADFVYDDTRAIVSNDDLRPTASWTSLLTNDFWGTPLAHSGSHKSFRPVCTASFRVNYLLGELSPYGYHLVNVVLHAVATVLFLVLCLHLFGGKLAVSSFAAVLFAVHPVHCEAVAGVVGRADVLACVFFLLASLCYLKACGSAIIPPITAIQRHRPTRIAPLHSVVAWLGCTSMCACLGMFSKESGITVLGVLVLYDVLVLSNAPLGSPWRILTEVQYSRLRLRTLWAATTAAALLGLRLHIMGHSPPEFAPADNPAASSDSVLTRTLHFWYLPAYNMWLLLYPHTLSFDWSMDAIPLVAEISDLRNLATVMFYAALISLSLYTLKKVKGSNSTNIPVDRSLPQLLSSNTLNLNMNFNNANVAPPRYTLRVRHGVQPDTNYGKPVSNGPFAGTQMYHPSSHLTPTLRLSKITSFSASTLASARSLSFGLLLLVIPFLPASNLLFHVGFVVAERVLYIPSMGFCVLVAQGVRALHNMTHSRPATTALQVACVSLLLVLSGRTYLRNWDWRDEESLYRSGIKVNPAKGWSNLGNVLYNKGMIEEAEEAYKIALLHRPNMADTHYNYGTLLLNQSRYEEATHRFRDAIFFRPKLAAAHLNLGIALSNMNQTQEAVKVYAHCSSLSNEGMKDPKQHSKSVTNCIFNLGKLYLDNRNPHEALTWLEKAQGSAPSGHEMQGIYNLLGETYSALGDSRQAEKFYLLSLSAKPSHLPAVIGYSNLLEREGRYTDAMSVLNAVRQQDASVVKVSWQKGLILLKMKDIGGAKEAFDHAISIAPRDGELILTAAHAFRENNEMSSAEHYYRKAVEVNPASASAHANLGAFLHLDKRHLEAEPHYARALELNPTDTVTRNNLMKLKSVIRKN